MNSSTAILLTCFNRKEKTLACLRSLYSARMPEGFSAEVFLVDDGSTDGTANAIKEFDPKINIIQGSGDLYWAGGMKLAFREAKRHNNYDLYLLLNDDVELKSDFILDLLETRNYCRNKHGKGGIYSSSTFDKTTDEISYGGNVLIKGIDNPTYELLTPTDIPQVCHLTNANILLVEKEVIDKIGFFDDVFIHGVADYDFSLRAFKAGFPVYITARAGGYCENDHEHNLSTSKSLKKRVQYLYSPTGLAYKEYLFYIRRHFPKHSSKALMKLWLKTFFPFLWEVKTKSLKNNH